MNMGGGRQNNQIPYTLSSRDRIHRDIHRWDEWGVYLQLGDPYLKKKKKRYLPQQVD